MDRGPSSDAHGVSKLSCYYGGSGEYVEVIATKTGEYAVVEYGQGEGYADEPAPRKFGMKTLATFTTSDPLDDAIVSADGGTYSAYGP